MTPRDRMWNLVKRLHADAKEHEDMANSLADIIPTLSDKMCKEIVDAWRDEEKPS